jgi:hypothetical protein
VYYRSQISPFHSHSFFCAYHDVVWQRLSRRPRAVPKKTWALAAHGSWQSGRLLTIEARYSVFVAGLRILIKGAAVIIDPLTRTDRGLGYQTSKTCDFFFPSFRPYSPIALSNIRRSGIAATRLAEIHTTVRSRLLGTPVNVSQTERYGQSAIISEP